MVELTRENGMVRILSGQLDCGSEFDAPIPDVSCSTCVRRHETRNPHHGLDGSSQKKMVGATSETKFSVPQLSLLTTQSYQTTVRISDSLNPGSQLVGKNIGRLHLDTFSLR